jgi:photosystem II stability/assembly factor-like uncharacterized protein
VKCWLGIGVLVVTSALAAQEDAVTTRRTESPVVNQSRDALLSSFRLRSIGPASMGGRVDDVEVAPSDHRVIYVGFATGGVFKSTNAGTTFAPVFETYGSASIGDIAIHPTNPDIIYVGTGEPNNRQTSSYGDGVYKTTDGGRHFTRIGLAETQTIARIVIDPRNPEIVYVAAAGHLYGPNRDRGLYKTTDGGQRWSKVKYVDEYTGFTDLVMDPSNSAVLYAASYQRLRTGCCFNGGGPGSALWKTTDAGKTWVRLTGNGLPPGPYGRIAIDVSRSNPSVVYAQIEAGESRLVLPGDRPGTLREVRPPPNAAGEYFASAGGDAARYWCNNAAATGSSRPTYVLDPTQGGVFRSEDGGRSWRAVSNCAERPLYFSQVRVDPNDPNTVYTSGGSPSRSTDGGRTFEKLDAVHSDQHAMWIDPMSADHLIVGNDGGIDISYDRGLTWDFVNTMATAQAYWVSADTGRPYHVYTGLQDNGSWGGPSAKRGRAGILNGDWFKLPCVGDGFVTAVNRERPNLVYCEGQDGAIQRVDLNTGRAVTIKPVSGPAVPTPPPPCDDGRAPNQPRLLRRGGKRTVSNAVTGDVYRFNWNTPFILSPHDADVVYLGGNRLFRSADRGDTWVASEDLTKRIDRCHRTVMRVRGNEPQLGKNDGAEWYGTITTISESPIAANVVWAGTDDGNLQMSRDSGRTFRDVTANLRGLPPNEGDPYWISRVDASHFDPATVYVAVDGHRSDDMKPYVFVTHDYGQTFRSIASDLPSFGNVLVVREDPKNRDLLFVGTELGVFVTLDGGKHWEPFMSGLPTVRTDDILIHPRDGDLIVATHGRSLWIADDITPLQQFTPSVAATDVFLFEPRESVAYVPDLTNNPYLGGDRVFVGENAPAGPVIAYYLKAAAPSDVRLTVSDATGHVVGSATGSRAPGIHRLQWPELAAGARGQGDRRLAPGQYGVRLAIGGTELTRTLTVLEDRWFKAR